MYRSDTGKFHSSRTSDNGRQWSHHEPRSARRCSNLSGVTTKPPWTSLCSSLFQSSWRCTAARASHTWSTRSTATASGVTTSHPAQTWTALRRRHHQNAGLHRPSRRTFTLPCSRHETTSAVERAASSSRRHAMRTRLQCPSTRDHRSTTQMTCLSQRSLWRRWHRRRRRPPTRRHRKSPSFCDVDDNNDHYY